MKIIERLQAIKDFWIKKDLTRDIFFLTGLTMLGYGLYGISSVTMYCVIGAIITILSLIKSFYN